MRRYGENKLKCRFEHHDNRVKALKPRHAKMSVVVVTRIKMRTIQIKLQ